MKRIKGFSAIAVLLACVCACGTNKGQTEAVTGYTSPNPYVPDTIPAFDENAEVRNVILMIGDGMGLEQASCAWICNRGALYLDQMPVVGLSRTYSANSLITDSAAGGTALAAGQKTDNYHVGVDPAGNELETLMDIARQAGKRTGVVTTCRLNDATPADFCCHDSDRDRAEDIVADYLESQVDVIAGGGLRFWRNRSDSRDIISEMGRKGYSTALTFDEFAAAESVPALAVLADIELPVALERGDLYRDMVAKTLDLLSADGNSFFAMLEGSCIDDWLHANRIDLAVEEALDFDRTIGDVLKWAAADGHTLVVVTADHATGSLTIQDGSIEEGRVEVNFASEGHNGIAVPYYVWGPGSGCFGGIYENAGLSDVIAGLLRSAR